MIYTGRLYGVDGAGDSHFIFYCKVKGMVYAELITSNFIGVASRDFLLFIYKGSGGVRLFCTTTSRQ